ncbi:FxsB family cyclophane-forming radical SAM/SPASM peptide maturase [Sphaerisporangium rubeum]|uniref:FxsB family cyclophane-forming radical SAM/SPASM peptide maturase n=1 Tax=Sphaerisporangium rubeum TaxID=321317 RepID=UPI00160B2F0E|nr:FxsB family cyclophane-forming radical SAM/SPASM peptide maturase [Sphaerisporangium rubeum]
MLASGWHPAPLREFVLKVHSRCDLACDYCYVYRFADQRWRTQPRTMTSHVAELTAGRIAEHVRDHRLTRIRVILHGGEPLLRTPDDLAAVVTRVRRAVGPAVTVDASVQTNGVRLSEDYLRAFDQAGVRVGVSLDGDAADHDRHRRGPDGRGSHAAVTAAIRLLTSPRYRHLFGGLLCVIDPRTDPAGVYRSLSDLDPPMIDFLLPHGHWSSPPPGREAGDAATPYADWLITVFDLWYGASAPPPPVRLLESIVHTLLGGGPAVQGIGLGPVQTVVVETDGTIEQGDVLKTSRAGTTRSTLNVASAAFDRVLLSPPVVAQQLGPLALAPVCRSCDLRRTCGGGQYAHRYRDGAGFANPSVYCPDLYRLISHIRRRLRDDLTGRGGVAG